MQKATEKEQIQSGLSLHQKGDLEGAEKVYHQILLANPKHDEALHLLGVIRFKQARIEDARYLIEQALAIDPKYAAAEFNLALCFDELKQFDESLVHFEGAAKLGYDPAMVASCIGSVKLAQRKYAEALKHLDEALRLNPKIAKAHCNRSIVLDLLGDLQSAASAADRALALDPYALSAHISKVHILSGLDDNVAALAQIAKAEKLNLRSAKLSAEKGRVLIKEKNILGGLAEFKKAKAIDPNFQSAVFDEISAKLKICLWTSYDDDVARLVMPRPVGQVDSNPLLISYTLDNLAENMKVAQAVVIEHQSDVSLADRLTLPAIGKRTFDSKIHLGYFSADLHNHPVGQLVAGVIENHDKEKFVVHVFSQGKSTGDNFENRIVEAATHYYQTSSFNHATALSMARDKGLSIALDLNGYTGVPRLPLAHNRVAPVQVNYLGYPGTLGSPFIDYMIADKVVIPPEYYSSCTEKIVQLPNCFLPNDRSRSIERTRFQRSELDLPADGIIFCSFNNTIKYNPPMFSVWMNIMRRIPLSVLWLSGTDLVTQENLKREATSRGIDSQRLIFSKFAPREEYFDRISVADLFLDSFPYNAHTTAADALWSGVPLLTMTGEIFASRVAASALHAVGLPELITSTPSDYEEKAVKLASDPAVLFEMKKHLQKNRLASPLFDIVTYTRNLEKAFIAMDAGYKMGRQPEHIKIEADRN